MKPTIRIALIALCVAALSLTLFAQQQMPQTKKESIENSQQVSTEQFNGTVVIAQNGTLVVKMANGDLRTFNPPESRRFLVDGKELTVNELKPGTKLHATVTTTKTSITDRTTTVGSGKVWFVSGNTVILTLPNNENRQYKVQESYRFTVDGKPASVHDLRKGMTVAAQKIVEEPRVEIASNTSVTGEAPPPPKPVAEAPAPAPAPRRAAAPPPPAPAPAAAPEPAAPAAAPEPAPTKLPKTGSPLPLIGLLGLLSTGTSFALRAVRR